MSTASTCEASIGSTTHAASRASRARPAARSRSQAAAALLLLTIAPPPRSVRAQHPETPVVRVIAPDSARSATLLRSALAAADLRLTDSSDVLQLSVPRAIRRSVVVIGGPAIVATTVHGDVVVVGGDLFVHPGAAIVGRAVAIGGGVYPSMLATIGGEVRSFRDETYDAARDAGGITLRHRPLGVDRARAELPVLAGLRIPAYDRSNGLSLAWGPLLRPTRTIEAEPTVTYRSDLGAFDPMVGLRWSPGTRDTLRLHVGRETATNERWIRGDLLNGLLALWSGDDERNYFRRDVARAELSHSWARGPLELSASAGALTERAWSVGPDSGDTSAPWSILERHDVETGMARPNPSITRGRISSALAGTRVAWRAEDVSLRLAIDAELVLDAPGDERFLQVGTSASVGFTTFGSQRLAVEARSLVTGPARAPRQRWSYVGGAATLPTVEPTLALGGDQLLFVNMDYQVPIERVQLPFVGSPVVSLVALIGGAGSHRLPALTENVGAVLAIGVVRGYAFVDPATRRRVLSVSLSVVR